MPPLTGAAAKQMWIKYWTDLVNDSGQQIVAKMRVSRRHIHWLQSIDPALVVSPGDEDLPDIHSLRLIPRTLGFASGTKRRQLRYPVNNTGLWRAPLANFDSEEFGFEGETPGIFKLVNRHGERESKGPINYDGS